MWQTCIVLPLLLFTLSNALLLPACVNAGVRQHGKVHVYSLFKEEVIVPMFDLHFRNVQIQGFWLTQWLQNLPSQEARQEVYDKIMGYMADGTISPPDASKQQ